MTVTKVQTIAEADAGPEHHKRLKRLKYVHGREMLDEYRASNASIGRTVCPVCDYLTAHIDDDVIELERAVYNHPDWGPSVLMETIINTPKFNDPSTAHGAVICAAVQHCAALALVDHPWERARPFIEGALRHPDTVFVSGDALDVLLAAVRKNHPNPKRFIGKPDVISKMPSRYDFTGWPAPDFPDLLAQPLVGARG